MLFEGFTFSSSCCTFHRHGVVAEGGGEGCEVRTRVMLEVARQADPSPGEGRVVQSFKTSDTDLSSSCTVDLSVCLCSYVGWGRVKPVFYQRPGVRTGTWAGCTVRLGTRGGGGAGEGGVLGTVTEGK